MAKNNKGIILLGNKSDAVHRANKNRKSAMNVEMNRYKAKKQDILNTIEMLHPSREFIKNSEHIINSSSNNWNKKPLVGSNNKLKENLSNAYKLNFFDIVTHKSHTGEQLMNEAIKLNSLNGKIVHSNQKGSANESLASWNESFKYYNEVKDKGGSLFVWDLETTGGKATDGVWRPGGITEFALQELNFSTQKGKDIDFSKVKKTNILVGLTKDEGRDIAERIEKAIINGTIDSDEELKVSAMRFAKYSEAKARKVTGKGYYEITDFPTTDSNNYKNIEAIRKGIQLHVDAGTYSAENAVNGIRADHYAMATAMNNVMKKTNAGTAVLAGYNDSGHDQLIMNQVLGQLKKQYGDPFSNLFDDGLASLNLPSKASLDVLGQVKLYTEYFPINSLYPGQDISNIDKIRGQENLVKFHLDKLLKKNKWKAHTGQDDVSALMGLIASPSDILDGKSSLVEYLQQGIEKINYSTHNLNANQHILRAKKGYNGDYSGKRFLNFAQSKSKGTVFTSSNYMIGAGDAALEANEGVLKEGFSLGFGINKGAFYDILDIKDMELNDTLRNTLENIAPEYSSNKLYHVQLGMLTDKKYKNTKLEDLTQNLIFKSEKEMNAFLSGYFDVVAERGENGSIKIAENMEKHFDLRELRNKKNKAYLKEVSKTSDQTEAVTKAVKASNEKLLLSRADNNILGDNSYRKISKALTLKKDLEKVFNKKIEGSDISLLMSEAVSQGKMPIGLNNSNVAEAQKIITTALEYNAHNTKRLLASSVDNMATGITMLSSYEKVLDNILTTLNQSEAFTKQSSSAKQEIFSRVFTEVKRSAADHVYGKEGTVNRMVLGNKRLTSSFEEFKNLYEIDYSSLIKGSRVDFMDMANPSFTNNILKLDLSNSNSIYNLMNTAVDAVYGDPKKFKEGVYKQNAIEKMFTMLNDTELGKTKAFGKAKKRYGFNGKGFEKKEFYQDDIAQTILTGMKQLKSKNATNGIINLDYAYMKTLNGHKGFVNVLNSQKVLDLVPDIANNVVNNYKQSDLKTLDDAKQLASQLIDKHYMPNIDDVKGAPGWNRTKEILYKNARKDMQEYMSDILYGAVGIEGAKISVQPDGNLIFNRNGRYESLENLIPKVGLDKESGVLDIRLGSMKMQLNSILNFGSTGPSINGSVGTSLSQLNNFSISKNVRYSATTDGADAGTDKLFSMLKYANKNLRELSTINGYSGNDIDSNYGVDVSNIKNILVELFKKDGKHAGILNETNLLDDKLSAIMRNEHLKSYINGDKELKELSPEMVRDLSKNIQYLVNSIIDFDPKAHTEDFKYMARDISFSNAESKVSSMVGMKEYRPYNSTFGIVDNMQRPPVTQSGNAIFLDSERIKKSKILKPGSIIGSNSVDSRTIRKLNGKEATTDVMMNVLYADNIAFKSLIENNFDAVMAQNQVGFNTEQEANKAYHYIKNSVSTFEQERIIDSRVHEAAYGFKTADVQKLSKNFDVKKPLTELKGSDYEKQINALLDYRGNFELNGDNIEFKSSTGKLLRRGESALKWKGFADIDSSFSSKMQYGVFNFNFYKKNGVKVTDEEINAILKSNRSNFLGPNKKLLSQYEMASKLEDILAKNDIKGQFAIEDISALGYAKTVTGAEKGMTDIVYSSTGSYNKDIEKFFKKIGKWEIVKGKVVTNEAVDAILADSDNRLVKTAMESFNIKGNQGLKQMLSKERHMHSALLFDHLLGKKTQIIANDALGKHENLGQMYQGTLAKAIDLLSSEYKDTNKAVNEIARLMGKEEFGFIENLNLKATNKKDRVHSYVKAKNVKGRLIIDDNYNTDGDIVTNFNATKFKKLLIEINKNLKGEKIVQNIDGKEIYGSHYIQDGKILGTNTYEPVKYVKDSETQTGVTAEYFALKKKSIELKKRKIALEGQIAATSENQAIKEIDNEIERLYSELSTKPQNKKAIKNLKEKRRVLVRDLKAEAEADLLSIKAELKQVDNNISSYSGAVKEMRFGDQELSIVERITITKAHADEMQSLIDSGEISDYFIDNSTLKNYVSINEEGARVIDDSFQETGNMKAYLDELKSRQYFQKGFEEELTLKDIEDAPYLKHMYEYGKTHGFKVGKDSAMKQHQINLAHNATLFNDSMPKMSMDKMLEDEYEVKNIKDVLFNADNIVEKNIIVDLGKEFNENRYVAVPGTGISIADEEVKDRGHKALTALKIKYDEYASYGGQETEEALEAKAKVLNRRDDVIEAVQKTVTGKNGLKHNASKITIDSASYRLKASGIVAETATPKLKEIAEGLELDLYDGSQGLTKRAKINGISIAEWEGKGNAFFDYKFVSRQKFEEMGMFSDETLSDFKFLNEAGTNKAEAIAKMEEHLKSYGSFDITDRYPNTRSGSLNLTKVFLDDQLAGNQTKVSIATVMKANGDNDGDSYSSFIADLWDGDRKINGALYELARNNGGRDSGYMSAEVYDKFEAMDNILLQRAYTSNRQWQKIGAEKILKDFKKNIDVSNPDSMVVVPGGKSVLGNYALSARTTMPTEESFIETEKKVNELLSLAYETSTAEDRDKFNVEIKNAKKSTKLLDEALYTLEESGKFKEQITGFENAAIERIRTDKYAQEIMAKTGLAATGSVNYSLNAVKLAAHFSSADEKDLAFTNYIWDVLDVAEQGVISSKHMETAGYNDTRIIDFKKSMMEIYKKGDTNKRQAVEGLTGWLDEFGDGIFKTSYEKMGSQILSPEQLKTLAGYDKEKELIEGTKMMRNHFTNKITEWSKDDLFVSYMGSVEGSGRNGSQVRRMWDDGTIGAAAAHGRSLASREQGMSGYDNPKTLERIFEARADSRIGQMESNAAKIKLETNDSMGKAKQKAMQEIAETLQSATHNVSKGRMGGLGMAMVGVAAGLMVGGYASGNPLNEANASEINKENQKPVEPVQTMSIPDFMDKESGYVTGNSQRGYIINIKADTKKGRKHLEGIMNKAAEATVGGAVSVNMNIKNISRNGITDRDVEQFMNKFI